MDKPDGLGALIQFLKEVETFKTCERTCHTTRNDRTESDAEHTWHLALLLMLLEKEWQGLDFTKILKMALIHDLPEIYAGDTNPYRGNTQNKEADERQAAARLFSSLPRETGREFMDLFEEYLRQDTPEARVVKAADKLMPLIQNLCTNQTYSSYRHLGVRYEEVRDYMDPFFTSGRILDDFYRELVTDAREQGVFAKK